MRDIYKPRGRVAHAGRSSRVGTAWDSEVTPIYVGPDKKEYNAQQFYGKYGNSKLAKSEPVKTSFDRRTHCNQILEMDCRGFAFCPKCGKIFNEGSSADDDCPTYEEKSGTLEPPAPV